MSILHCPDSNDGRSARVGLRNGFREQYNFEEKKDQLRGLVRGMILRRETRGLQFSRSDLFQKRVVRGAIGFGRRWQSLAGEKRP